MNLDQVLVETEDLLTEMLCAKEQEIFEKFMTIPGAQSLSCTGCSGNAVYIPGSREDTNRVLLVAHYDTVWSDKHERELYIDGTQIYSAVQNLGIGADDRLGCAALWLLRNTGHSLLLVPDEESGCEGSQALMDNPAYVELLKQHSFLIQFDRRGASDVVTYDCEHEPFIDWIVGRLPGYTHESGSFSDIAALMEPLDLCGCNLSIGFRLEHTKNEWCDMLDFLRTVELTRRMIMGETPRFKYEGSGSWWKGLHGRYGSYRGTWKYEDEPDHWFPNYKPKTDGTAIFNDPEDPECYCAKCSEVFDGDEIQESIYPQCPLCGGWLEPLSAINDPVYHDEMTHDFTEEEMDDIIKTIENVRE